MRQPPHGTDQTSLRLATLATPIGTLTLVAGEHGLRALLFAGQEPPAGAQSAGDPLLERARRQLDAYFAGRRRAFELPLELQGSPFQRRAWLALRAIPYGRTRSYGEQARLLGRPAAARAVGAANARNPLPILLPCHRLIGADGSLTGFGGGLAAKQALLEHEARVLASTSV